MHANEMLQTQPDWSILRAQFEACAAARHSCGAECQRHAGLHEYGRVCAEACERLLQVMLA